MVVDTPIVASQGNSAVPDTRVCEVACSLGQCAAPGALINLHTEANGGDFQSSQITTRIVEIIGHIGITARGTGSSRTARAGIACVFAGRRREYDGHIAAGDSAYRHAARGQVGGKIGTCSKGICAGAAKGRRDQGCIFADILILHCPTISRVDYLDRSRIPVIRITGGVNTVVQGAGRQGQCRRQAKRQASGNYSFHSLSSSVVSWRRFINKAAPVPAPTRATIPKGTAMANQLNWAGPVLSSSVGRIGSSGVPSKIAT